MEGAARLGGRGRGRCWRGGGVVRMSADGEGGTVEREMTVEVLAEAVAADAPVGAGEPRGVAELRALRAGRHRWDWGGGGGSGGPGGRQRRLRGGGGWVRL